MLKRLFEKVVRYSRSLKNREITRDFDPTDRKDIFELEKHWKNPYLSHIISRVEEHGAIDQDTLEQGSIETFEANPHMPVMVSFDSIRTFDGKKLGSEDEPLTHTALDLIRDPSISVLETYLYKFCKEFVPKNYGEIFGISTAGVLGSLSQYTEFLPWIHNEPREDRRAGTFGPKDETYFEHNKLRLQNLLYLIEKYSYVPSFGDVPTGYVLSSGRSWQFILQSGHHRLAVLMALRQQGKHRLDSTPVKGASGRFWSANKMLFRREESSSWPAVNAGALSETEALELFRCFFVDKLER